MKKIHFKLTMFAMIVTTMCFIACNNDDETEKPSENYATVYGTVANSVTGELVSTATVELYRMIMSKYLVTTTITGTDGFFSFPEIEYPYTGGESTYIIEVSHPDYQPYSQAVKLRSGSKLEINVSVQPKK